MRAADAAGTIGMSNAGWGGFNGPITNLAPMIGVSLGFQVIFSLGISTQKKKYMMHIHIESKKYGDIIMAGKVLEYGKLK